MPTSLSTLPDELLLRIVELVKEADPALASNTQCSPSLLRLALTSHRLNRITRPHIYQELHSTRNQTGAFLDAITAKPELGRLVKQIVWECRACEDYDAMWIFERQAQFRRVGGWLHSLAAEPERGKGFTALLESKRKMGVCVRAAPNVERVEIIDAFMGEDDGVHWTDGIRARGAGEFQRLKSVSLCVSRVHVSHLRPILDLPSMRRLELSGLAVVDDDDEPRSDAFPPAPGSSRITHFALKHSCIPSAMVACLLPVFKALTSFEHHSIGDPISPFYTAPDYALIVAALATHTTTLTHLTFYDTLDIASTRLTRLPSLSHFPALEDLRIPYTCLFGPADTPGIDPAWTTTMPESVASLSLCFVQSQITDLEEEDAEWGGSELAEAFQELSGRAVRKYRRGIEALAERKKQGGLGALRVVEVDAGWERAGAEVLGEVLGEVRVRWRY